MLLRYGLMRAARRFRYLILGLFLYAGFCAVGGFYLADGALHPARRPLTEDEFAAMRHYARALNAGLEEVSPPPPMVWCFAGGVFVRCKATEKPSFCFMGSATTASA
jgi:hypothetical protein